MRYDLLAANGEPFETAFHSSGIWKFSLVKAIDQRHGAVLLLFGCGAQDREGTISEQRFVRPRLCNLASQS
jgi:hypothetical protein